MNSVIFVSMPDDYLEDLLNLFSDTETVDAYSHMLKALGSVVFEIENELDRNRVSDVTKLREIYGGNLDEYPATILEILMALCMRFCEEIGDNWEEIFWITLDKIGYLRPKFYNENFDILDKEFMNCCKKLFYDSEIFTKNPQSDSKIFTKSSQFADFFDEKSGNYGDFMELPKVDLWRQLMVWWSKNRMCDKKV